MAYLSDPAFFKCFFLRPSALPEQFHKPSGPKLETLRFPICPPQNPLGPDRVEIPPKTPRGFTFESRRPPLETPVWPEIRPTPPPAVAR